MPYCSTHGFQQGKHCSQCGAPLSDSPPATGDRIQWRSPEATAIVNIAQEAKTRSRSPEVECPRCGHLNAMRNTFNCKGGCGEQNLCRRHFDEDYEVCKWCADERRGTAKAEAERQAKLHVDLAAWRKRAEQAETQVSELTQHGQQAQQALERLCVDLEGEQEHVHTLERQLGTARDHLQQAEALVTKLTQDGQQMQHGLEQARADLHQAQDRVRSLEQELAAQRRRAEQAEINLAQRTTDLSQAQERVQALEKDLAGWRGRAEKAEGELAAIVRIRQEDDHFEWVGADEALRGVEVAEPPPEPPLVPKGSGRARRPVWPLTTTSLSPSRAVPYYRSVEANKQDPVWQQIGIDLLRIPAGEFLYGDEKRKVQLPEYWIAKTPVTNAQYKAFVDATGHRAPDHWKSGRIPSGEAMHPVMNVSWDDAQAFCRWAGLRLPTEQEWEKSARGADGRDYPWGNQAPNVQLCNFDMNVDGTTPVGKYLAGASPYRLLDMAGNVREWCEDRYDTEHNYRVLRGGSWLNDASYVRVVLRGYDAPDNRAGHGFRPARS